MSDHISVDELADAAEGLLEPARADTVDTHVADCPICHETVDLLAAVTGTLAAEPDPMMPPGVIARLDAVVADEQTRRTAKGSGALGAVGLDPAGQPGGSHQGAVSHGQSVIAWAPRQRLHPPEHDQSQRHHSQRGHYAGWILAAAGVATLVGFGGYVISARAGLNEPPTGVAAMSSSDLRQEASALEARGSVDPHRFSRAWSCARQATDGRITGIASVTVDGSPALLVYLSNTDGAVVSVVEGCDGQAPRVTATTPLGR